LLQLLILVWSSKLLLALTSVVILGTKSTKCPAYGNSAWTAVSNCCLFVKAVLSNNWFFCSGHVILHAVIFK
jgi:hypothetical protein